MNGAIEVGQSKEALRRYTCGKGHSLEIRGTWTSFVYTRTLPDGSLQTDSYDFCMACMGEEAQRRYPLTCEIIDEPEAAT